MTIQPRCDTCAEDGRKGYCAPLRCYCGHPDCYAFASYVEPKRPTDFDRLKTVTHDSSWAEREEGSSWIDKL